MPQYKDVEERFHNHSIKHDWIEFEEDEVSDRTGTDDGNYHHLKNSITKEDPDPVDRLIIVPDGVQPSN